MENFEKNLKYTFKNNSFLVEICTVFMITTKLTTDTIIVVKISNILDWLLHIYNHSFRGDYSTTTH